MELHRIHFGGGGVVDFQLAGHVFFSEHCELEAPNRHPQAECHKFSFEIFVFPVQSLN